MKLRVSELGSLMERIGIQLKEGWTAMRNQGLDVAMETELEVVVDIIDDDRTPLAIVTETSEESSQVQESARPQSQDTTTQSAALQTTTDAPVKSTQTEKGYTQTNRESSYKEVTEEAAVKDTSNTSRAANNVTGQSGGDSMRRDEETVDS